MYVHACMTYLFQKHLQYLVRLGTTNICCHYCDIRTVFVQLVIEMFYGDSCTVTPHGGSLLNVLQVVSLHRCRLRLIQLSQQRVIA